MVLSEARDEVTIDTMAITDTKVMLPAFFVNVGGDNETVLVDFPRVVWHEPLFRTVGET